MNRNVDIVARLEDLHKQATTEQSHYYVAGCVRDAIREIKSLRFVLKELYDVLPSSRDWLDPDLERYVRFLFHGNQTERSFNAKKKIDRERNRPFCP